MTVVCVLFRILTVIGILFLICAVIRFRIRHCGQCFRPGCLVIRFVRLGLFPVGFFGRFGLFGFFLQRLFGEFVLFRNGFCSFLSVPGIVAEIRLDPFWNAPIQIIFAGAVVEFVHKPRVAFGFRRFSGFPFPCFCFVLGISDVFGILGILGFGKFLRIGRLGSLLLNRFGRFGRFGRFFRSRFGRLFLEIFGIGHGRHCNRSVHAVAEHLLGVADLRGADGLFGHGLRDLRRRRRFGLRPGRSVSFLRLGSRFRLRFGFRLGSRFGFGFRFGLRRVVVQFPEHIRARRDNAFVHIGRLRHVILRQFKRRGGLFLTDILADYAAPHQFFGFLKRVGFLVVDLFDIDRGQSLFLGHALNQFQRPTELPIGTHLIFERRIGIPFLVSDIPPVINAVLQTCRIKRQIQLQTVAADVDFCNGILPVRKAVRIPADARFRSLVGKKRILEFAVVMLDVRARLDQSALKALAIVRNDIATRFLVVADDPLVSAETVGIVRVVHKVLVVLAVVLRRFLGAFVLVILRRVCGNCRADGYASVPGLFRLRLLCFGFRLLRRLVGALLTDQRFHQGAEQLFGLRLTRRCRRRLRCGRGGLGLANRFGDGFLHVYESAARRVRRTALCVRGCHAARRRFCLCGMLFRIRTDPCLALLRGGGLGAFRFRALSFLFAQTLLGFHLPSCFFSPLGAQSFTRLGFRGKVCGGTLRRLAVKARLFLPLEAEALLLFAPQIRRHKVVTDRARNDNQQGQCRRADNRQNQQNPQNRLRRKRAEKSLPRKQERIGAVVVISPVVPPFRLYHPPDQYPDRNRFKGENQCRNRNGKIDPSLPVAEQSGKPHPNR